MYVWGEIVTAARPWVALSVSAIARARRVFLASPDQVSRKARGGGPSVTIAPFASETTRPMRECLRPMRNDDARHVRCAQRLVDRPPALDIEMARRLVQHENSGPTIERAREQHALLLSARQHGPHVADQRSVAHRHADDVIMNRCLLCTCLDPLLIGALGKKAVSTEKKKRTSRATKRWRSTGLASRHCGERPRGCEHCASRAR